MTSSMQHVSFKQQPITTMFAKDAMDELNDIEGGEMPNKPEKKSKQSVMLEPEVTIFEGAPSATEVILPAVSVITVVGIIPFAAAVSRQVWVRYKITSRRISVQSGIGGKDLTEIVYSEIRSMKFIYRAFGAAGDVAITLADGSKLELRSLPNFEELYTYMYNQLSPSAQADSDQIKKKD